MTIIYPASSVVICNPAWKARAVPRNFNVHQETSMERSQKFGITVLHPQKYGTNSAATELDFIFEWVHSSMLQCVYMG